MAGEHIHTISEHLVNQASTLGPRLHSALKTPEQTLWPWLPGVKPLSLSSPGLTSPADTLRNDVTAPGFRARRIESPPDFPSVLHLLHPHHSCRGQAVSPVLRGASGNRWHSPQEVAGGLRR